jgi:hypothetical protein
LACPAALTPSFEDLLASRITTARHIPSACRRTVASCLATLIADFVQHESWESLHRLQCFSKLVLRAPKRAGRSHAKKAALDVARRLRLFEQGQIDTLWKEASTSFQKDKPARTRSQVKAKEDTLPKSVLETIRGGRPIQGSQALCVNRHCRL